MAGFDKVVISQLDGENWPVWKAKFQALLEYKGDCILLLSNRSRMERTKSVGSSQGVDDPLHPRCLCEIV